MPSSFGSLLPAIGQHIMFVLGIRNNDYTILPHYKCKAFHIEIRWMKKSDNPAASKATLAATARPVRGTEGRDKQ